MVTLTRTTFVGRTREKNHLAELIERVSLVTLTGVGGAGKTRLAAEVAGEVDVGQERRGGLTVRADQAADPLDQVEQLLALLAHQRAAEQDPELADVAAQAGLRLSRGKSDSCDRRRTRRGPRGRRG